MGIPIDKIKDPRLRARVEQALASAGELKKAIANDARRPSRRIRQDHKPLMNKLEQEYYDRFLKGRNTISPVFIQSLRFRLANGLWYKPDFFSIGLLCASNVAIEVKGPHAYRGGFENLKMAASQYPSIKWVLVWKEKGDWQEQAVIP